MNYLCSVFLIAFLELFNASQDVELLFAGDAMQHLPQIQNAGRAGGTYDYSGCFKYLEPDILSADLAVVNLELPLGGKPYSGYPCFCAPDEFALQLQKSGFDLFLTANNHCLDRRDAGLKRTIETLDKYNIDHIGTYRNVADRDTLMPYIADVEGIRIAFMNYTYGTNGIPVQGNVVVDYIDKAKILSDINRARAKGAQLLCVCMHWGDEYHLLPNKTQKELADFLIDNGVDLIIGGHPHVIQPMEIRHSGRYNKDVLVVYSLGNFISNMKTTDTRGGAMVKVRLCNDNDGVRLKGASYKLFYTQTPTPAENLYILIPEYRSDVLNGAHKANFNAFMRSANGVFGKYNHNVEAEK